MRQQIVNFMDAGRQAAASKGQTRAWPEFRLLSTGGQKDCHRGSCCPCSNMHGDPCEQAQHVMIVMGERVWNRVLGEPVRSITKTANARLVCDECTRRSRADMRSTDITKHRAHDSFACQFADITTALNYPRRGAMRCDASHASVTSSSLSSSRYAWDEVNREKWG